VSVGSDWIVLCTLAVIYVLAGIMVIRGCLPVSVISVPRISLGGHLAAITSLMSNWLPGWLLWKGLGDYSCLLVDVHAFFVRNIYNEKKEKKVKKGEKIDRDTWAYSRFRRGGKERRYSCRRQKKKNLTCSYCLLFLMFLQYSVLMSSRWEARLAA